MSHQSQSLDEMLARLPEEMPFPPTPDIASRIGSQLPDRTTSRSRSPAIWMVAAAALLLVSVTLALPGPRNAVADLLGLPGIRIEIIDRGTTTGKPTAIGSTILFGKQTTLHDAQEQVPFAIAVPNRDGLREPDEVWLRSADDITAVSLIYAATDELPEIGDTGVGMLLMEIRSPEGAPLVAKRSMGSGSLELVYINGGREAFWVENGELVTIPHDPLIVEPGSQSIRRSGNVLIWSDGRTTFRLETMLDRDAAIALAESLRPWRSLSGGNRIDIPLVWREELARHISGR